MQLWAERRIGRVDAKRTLGGEHRMVSHELQKTVRLSVVVIQPRAVPPGMRGEVQAHDEVLFSIRRRRI